MNLDTRVRFVLVDLGVNPPWSNFGASSINELHNNKVSGRFVTSVKSFQSGENPSFRVSADGQGQHECVCCRRAPGLNAEMSTKPNLVRELSIFQTVLGLYMIQPIGNRACILSAHIINACTVLQTSKTCSRGANFGGPAAECDGRTTCQCCRCFAFTIRLLRARWC